MNSAAETRAWLNRLAISLLIALLAGALSYLVTRAVTTAYLFYQQQQFFQETAGILQGGGIASLANGNLRELRLLVETLDRQYNWLSIQIGFAAAAVAAALSYLWLERRAATSGAPQAYQRR